MPASSLSPFVIVLGAIIGGFCFLRSIANLASALHLLVLVLIFGGIVGVNLGGSGFVVPFRDAVIVLPLYLSVLTTNTGQQAITRIPIDLVLSIGSFLVVILVCLLNPVNEPLAQIVIGLKVWLYYIPFIVVGIVLARRPEFMIRLLRQILLWGGIACAVGLAQSLLVRVLGYHAAIELFFGASANLVTQEFAYFDSAGGIYRIPGTFSFVAQYGSFIYLYLTIAVMVVNWDPDMQIQRLARVAVFVAVLAGLLSGTRAMILVLPAMLVLYALLGLLNARLLLFAPVGLAAVLGILSLAGVDLIAYFFVGQRMAMSYTDQLIFTQISQALDTGLIGAGIGASTSAARYAFGATSAGDGLQYLYESYFAKAAAELGWLGLIAISVLFAVVAWRCMVTVQANLWHRGNAIVAPAAVYLLANIILSLKSFVLDTDPGNIFFWLFLGLMIGVDPPRRGAVVPDDPVTSKGLCQHERGADALVSVFVVEDGKEDAVH